MLLIASAKVRVHINISRYDTHSKRDEKLEEADLRFTIFNLAITIRKRLR